MNRRQFHRTLAAILPAAALAQVQQSGARQSGTQQSGTQQSGTQHRETSITKERTHMQLVDKLMRFKMAVSDMPNAKAFYADKLGLKVETDYRRDDHNWWVSLTLPEN